MHSYLCYTEFKRLKNIYLKKVVEMKLFHGSNVIVNTPRILTKLRALDFGAGFYLTSSKEQTSMHF